MVSTGKPEFNLKEYLVSNTPSHRLLMQLQCVDQFKNEESDRQHVVLSWDDAMMLWISMGLAKKFAEAYNEQVTLTVLYQMIRKI